MRDLVDALRKDLTDVVRTSAVNDERVEGVIREVTGKVHTMERILTQGGNGKTLHERLLLLGRDLEHLAEEHRKTSADHAQEIAALRGLLASGGVARLKFWGAIVTSLIASVGALAVALLSK